MRRRALSRLTRNSSRSSSSSLSRSVFSAASFGRKIAGAKAKSKVVSDMEAPLPLKRVRRALRRSGGNLRQAAADLKIPKRELRSLIDAEPELLEQALEANERALDKVEATIRQAMREGDPRKAMAAAAAIVRTSPRWRK